MRVLDEVTSASGVSGGGLPGNSALVLLQQLLDMLGSSEPNGGLVSIVEGFRKAGLGDVMSSWIGTGWSLAISPQDLQRGLGTERLQQLVRSSGLPEDAVASALARLLPAVMAALTKGGEVPEPRRLQRRVLKLKRALGQVQPHGDFRARRRDRDGSIGPELKEKEAVIRVPHRDPVSGTS
jgi:uncharacterized protein YidB (DUF937 family)